MIGDIFHLLVEKREFFSGLLLEHLEISLAACLTALVLGGIAGILISEYRRAARPTLTAINFLYTIPSISMLGFLIPFTGIGNRTAILALTIYALLPMVRNTCTGMSQVDPAILEAAKGMGSTRSQILWKIQLPLALPVIFSGIRNMVIMTIALTGIASFIGAGGLGVAIYRGITTNHTALTVTGSLLIALMALAADGLLGFVEQRLQCRGPRARRQNRRLALGTAALLLCLGGSLLWPGEQARVVHIATKPMTEQYILGQMLKLLIEQDTDLKVQLTQGVGGGTSNIQPGMEKGAFDLYPEYTGTGWNMVLKQKGLYSEEQFGQLQQGYETRLHMKWVGLYGFNNTYGLAVRKEIADRYGLRTCSDLKKADGQLVLGAEYDFFERQDGYEALTRKLGVSFRNTRDMDIGLKYQALAQKKIDIMPIFTTDGQLSQADAVVLEDDLHLYPSYRCGTVVREDVLQKYPELAPELEKLQGQITDEDMRKMNHEVETEKKQPGEVAQAFLQARGLLR